MVLEAIRVAIVVIDCDDLVISVTAIPVLVAKSTAIVTVAYYACKYSFYVM